MSDILTGKAFLIVDAGNSETRAFVMYGRSDVPNVLNRYPVALPNVFAEHLGDSDPVYSEAVTALNSKILRVDSLPVGTGEESLSGTFVNGVLATREYSSILTRPSALTPKFTQATFSLTMYTVLIEAHFVLARAYNVPVDSVQVDFDVTVLLPPSNVGVKDDPKSGISTVSRIVSSISVLRSSLPEFERNIAIRESDVHVLPEGMVGFYGAVTHAGGKVRNGYASYMTGNVLVLDGGQGTTDVILMSKGNPNLASASTFDVGGNNTKAVLKSLLESKGIEINEQQAIQAEIDGFVTVGARKVDVSKFLTQARKQVALSLLGRLRDYFERSSFSLSEVNYVLVLGGCAVTSSETSVPPLSKAIEDELKKYMPSVEVIELPVAVNHDGSYIVARDADNNIIYEQGEGILTDQPKLTLEGNPELDANGDVVYLREPKPVYLLENPRTLNIYGASILVENKANKSGYSVV